MRSVDSGDPGVWYFDRFRFDAGRERLWRHGQRVALRPTTARVLVTLLHGARSPQPVLSKKTLIESAWATGNASDQSLFQAISELRRALAPLEAIVTVPNAGYRWVVPARRGAPRAMLGAAIAAGLCAVSLVTATVALRAPAPVSVDYPPSLSAFARGVAKLERARPEAAERLFRLALEENPGFSEAHLMVGEALLAQGRLDEARDLAESLLRDRVAHDAHARVSALALMSRAEEQAGRASRALHLALVAAERAQRGGFVCVAADIDDRIEKLLALSGPPSPSEVSPWSAPDAWAKMPRDPAATPAAPSGHCARLRGPAPLPDAQAEPAAATRGADARLATRIVRVGKSRI